jgi:hypothetical protein
MTESETRERLSKLPEPPWVREMKANYAETGTYRPEDLRRVLGDPTRGVEMPVKESESEHFSG